MLLHRMTAGLFMLLALGVAFALQAVPPLAPNAATASPTPRARTPEAFDLYPAPGSPPAPGANGWFKDLGKQKLDPEMLKAAGITDKSGSKRSRQPARKAKKADDVAEAPGSLSAVLGGFVVVLAIVFATQGGN